MSLYPGSFNTPDIFSLDLDLLGILDREGRFVEVNGRWADVLGFSPAQLEGTLCTDLVHEYDQAQFLDSLRAVRDDARIIEFRVRLADATGSPRFLEWRARGINGLIYASARDMTEQTYMELDLKHSRDQLRSLLVNIPGIAFRCRYDEHRTMLYMSDDTGSLTGYPSSAFTHNRTLSYRDAIHPDDREMVEDSVRSAISNDTSWELEYRVLHKDGGIRWAFEKGRASVGSDGSIEYLDGFILDITERKEMESLAYAARAEAERANRAKSDFLANMSHEIRTPLNAIIGFSELLRSTPMSDDQKQYLDSIHSSGQSLLEIIDDVLDFSKIEAGKLDLEIIEIDLPELLKQIIAILRFQAERKRLRLNLRTPPTLPRYWDLDPVRFKQIVLNLLSNAIKFTSEGSVTLEVLCIEKAEDRAELTILVHDTGIGIRPEDQNKLFKAFSQADSSTTRQFGGTGLGLIISNLLAGKMGGHIEVESEYGHGSTFSFTIQASCRTDSRERTVAAEADATPTVFDESWTPSILVAEDVKINRILARAMVIHIVPGAQITLVENGRRAVEAAMEQPFDLVLMDVQMPELDGIDATREIRALPDLTAASVPIVALTAGIMTEERARCLAAGMNAVLAKPLQPAVLSRTLQKLYDKKL
ncbi:MAG: PAS domain-containing protein [bacterium]